MNKQTRTVVTLVLMVQSLLHLSAQKHWSDALNPSDNFYSINENAQKYFQNKIKSSTVNEAKKLDSDWHKYMRWVNNNQNHIYPGGEFPDLIKIYNEQILPQKQQLKGTRSANWVNINQTSCTGGYNGMGRAISIAAHPTNANIFYVGTSRGGLWKTSDNGITYEPLTDKLPVVAAGHVILDKQNPNTLYINLGGHDSWWEYSSGIYKSTDGGTSWNATGLTFDRTDLVAVYDLKMHPANSQILLCATSKGMYKTTNSGLSWTKIQSSGSWMNVEFKINNGNTVYAFRNDNSNFYKSTDGGENFTKKTAFTGRKNGWIKTCAASNNYVAFSRNNELYVSTDGGENFAKKGTFPEFLHRFIVDPENQSIVYHGAMDNYKSTDGGSEWTKISEWANFSKLPDVHADLHYYLYKPADPKTLIIANDGGIYLYNTDTGTFTERTDGLIITMYYDVAASQKAPYNLMGGTQDNGGRRRDANGNWYATNGGDAMHQQIDKTDPDISYSTYCNGELYRTTNNWKSNTQISANIPGGANGEFVTPYQLAPADQSTIVIGYQHVWKSTDRGDSWTKIGDNLNEGKKMHEIAIAPSDSKVIYVSSNSKLFITEDNGANWSTTDFETTANGQFITGITVKPTDSKTLWICMGGYHNKTGKKVFKSTDGGTKWTDVTGSLPQIPCNDIIYQEDTNDMIYVAMDLGGLYFRDADMDNWADHSEGLPNTQMETLEIQYYRNKLIVGTYGRGIYEGELATASGSSTCKKPSGLSTSQLEANTAILSWDNVAAPNYTVWTKQAGSNWEKIADKITETSKTLTALKANTTYEVDVYANCIDGSLVSDRYAFTTKKESSSCEAPTNYHITDLGETTISVAWNTSGATNYTAWLKQGNGSWQTINNHLTGTSYTYTGLSPATAYEVDICANCADNQKCEQAIPVTTKSINSSANIGDVVRIESAFSNLWLKPIANDDHSQLECVSKTNTGNATQWLIEDASNGYLRFKSLSANRRMRPTGDDDNDPMEVGLTSWTGNYTHWRLTDAGNGTYYLTNRKTNKYIRCGSSTPGTIALQVPSTWAGIYQKWRLIKVASAGKAFTPEQASTANKTLTLFPNPASNYLYVSYEEGAANIEIFNSLGVSVGTDNLNSSGIKRINISHLQEGTYIFKLRTNNKVISKKFIKK